MIKSHHKRHSHLHIDLKTKLGVIAIGISLLAFIVNYIFNLLVSRHFPADVYGDFYVVLQIMLLCGILGVSGTNSSIVRFIPRYVAQYDNKKLRGYLAWNRKLVFKGTLALSVLGAMLAAVALLLDRLDIYSLNNVHPFVFAFWLIPLFIYSLLTNSVLQGFERVNLAMFLSTVLFYVFAIIEMILFVLLFKTSSIYSLLLLVGISQTLVVVIQLLLLKHKIDSLDPDDEDVISDKPSWKKYSQVMFFSNVLVYLADIIVLLVLEAIGKYEAEVGVFAAISTIVSIFFTISLAINTLIGPKLSKNADDPVELQKIVTQANILQLLITTPIVILSVWFAKDILFMFNPLFTKYVTYLNIAIISTYLFLPLSISATVLTYCADEKLEAMSNIVYLVSSLILAFVLILKFQLIGAIWAQVIGLTITYLFDFIACKKATKLKTLIFI